MRGGRSGHSWREPRPHTYEFSPLLVQAGHSHAEMRLFFITFSPGWADLVTLGEGHGPMLWIFILADPIWSLSERATDLCFMDLVYSEGWVATLPPPKLLPSR